MVLAQYVSGERLRRFLRSDDCGPNFRAVPGRYSESPGSYRAGRCAYRRRRRKTAKPKLPFAIAIKDGRPFNFAGLWENWKDPESGEWLRTCTIVTDEPNQLVAQIHPRMPVILPALHHAAWLGETDEGRQKFFKSRRLRKIL